MMAEINSSKLIPLSAPRAVLGPIPLTVISFSKKAFSSLVLKPTN
jgi:hypothetical protein